VALPERSRDTMTLLALINAADRGGEHAAETLFAALYQELHRLSQRELARHGGFATLGATTLLHEAYLDIAERHGRSFPDAARFMGYAARVMRGLIIDYARNRCALKRGGQFEITSLGAAAEDVVDVRELTEISDAIEDLAKVDRSLAEIVDLKFFCGFSFAEIGQMQQLSERTVQRKWEKARIFLYRSIRASLSD
jgi:RNA polymerase sigma factor (TIGR02999 family)